LEPVILDRCSMPVWFAVPHAEIGPLHPGMKQKNGNGQTGHYDDGH
jgi:hypothetical protein